MTDSKERYLADASAFFGDDWSVTYWQMSHGAGGGEEAVENWVQNADSLWEMAKLKISKI